MTAIVYTLLEIASCNTHINLLLVGSTSSPWNVVCTPQKPESCVTAWRHLTQSIRASDMSTKACVRLEKLNDECMKPMEARGVISSRCEIQSLNVDKFRKNQVMVMKEVMMQGIEELVA